ncbi:glycosyl transferase family 2 [Cryobacterium sp. LW097]|uniref:glycosyltransferase n=1 Tax=Cryobacterium sp. LW097 TaxID=1978566 RepID=UPI000B4DC405|nr:glycosyltransferase [Cryobacterium sp. LW097]ASD23156.1 glycosyl transferase family 2 [Cryobacterium sp. LW097]
MTTVRFVPTPTSLIFTVLNEELAMADFLQSIHALSEKPQEIVIVDGGSTDATVEIIRSWTPPEGVHVRVVVAPGANISAGRNQAIALASNPIIAVSDAGATLDKSWLERLVRPLGGTADVASGFFVSSGGSFWERAIGAVITPSLSEVDGESFLPSSRSIAFRKSVWDAAGGYPEWLDYCEDLLFDLQLKEDGAVFVFVPDAIASWNARPSLKAFAKQYYRYARGDGKSGLWRRRHVARYSAYALGLALTGAAWLSPWLLLVLLAGAAGYLAKFLRRVVTARESLGSATVWILLLAPAIVVIGDIAKMAGYPAGLVWRSRNQHVWQVAV